MPLFTTSATPDSRESLVPGDAGRTQLNIYNNMSGATVRVDEDQEEVLNSANIMKFEDSIIIRGTLATKRIYVTSDIASSTVNFTEIVG
jgi:hypothetical protein